MAKFFDIHPVDPQPRLVEQAAQVLLSGGLLAYPTDSGYALGCSLDNAAGRERIATIRHLGPRHHYTLVCRDFAQLGQFVQVGNTEFRAIKRLTPGPYTFILPGTQEVPRRLLQPKKKTVGARIPDFRFVQALLEAVGEPIASSTLIMPGETEPLTEGWVVQDRLDHLVDAVVDVGECGSEPTSVIDMSDGIRVAREGAGDTSMFE